MKKYYQALLTLTAALSLIALLFYRHEYNKLRFVLEFVNYFGTPNQKADCNCTEIEKTLNIYHSEFTSPESSWQRISEDLYIYSAYNYNNEEIRAISFGKNIDITKYSCHIFFDDDVKSIEGKIYYEIINNMNDETNEDSDNKYHGYFLICKFTEMYKKLIVGVQFKNNAQNKFNTSPVTQVHTLNNNKFNNSDNVICVAPPTEQFLNHMDMISFLAFHYYLNWKNFIIYDFGISHVLTNNLKTMSKLSDAQWNFTYTVIPWNFPYAQISYSTIRKIIETDCIYRTYNKSIMTVTLSWNEYINLRYHNSIENVLTDISNENNKLIDKFQLSTLIFCLNQDNIDVSIPLPVILKTTHRLRRIIDNDPHHIYKSVDISNIKSNKQDTGNLIYINRYQQCNIDDRREIVGTEILKYAESIPTSEIFQYFTAKKINQPLN